LIEKKPKAPKMKIKRQPGDMINLNHNSPRSPMLFTMDFLALEPVKFKIEKKKGNYKTMLYNTMK
jgi:5-hydroxyisourate hydrolase-like protein (transthyretin family)